MIFETQEELRSWLDEMNVGKGAAARYSVTHDTPAFFMKSPHFVYNHEDDDGATFYLMNPCIKTWEPVTNTFSGDFDICYPLGRPSMPQINHNYSYTTMITAPG
jgi:hypothetical protein